MGQHKFNHTAIAAKEGLLPPKDRNMTRSERRIFYNTWLKIQQKQLVKDLIKKWGEPYIGEGGLVGVLVDDDVDKRMNLVLVTFVGDEISLKFLVNVDEVYQASDWALYISEIMSAAFEKYCDGRKDFHKKFNSDVTYRAITLKGEQTNESNN